jgi:hypothetical protein
MTIRAAGRASRLGDEPARDADEAADGNDLAREAPGEG